MRVLEVGHGALPSPELLCDPSIDYVGLDSGAMHGPGVAEEKFRRIVPEMPFYNPASVTLITGSITDKELLQHYPFDLVYMANVLGDPSNNSRLAKPAARTNRRRGIIGASKSLLRSPGGRLMIVESMTPPWKSDVIADVEGAGLKILDVVEGEEFWDRYKSLTLFGSMVRQAIEEIATSQGGFPEDKPYLVEAVTA